MCDVGLTLHSAHTFIGVAACTLHLFSLAPPCPRYPLVVKLGTITPHGADVYRCGPAF